MMLKPSFFIPSFMALLVGCVSPNAVSMDEGQGLPLTTQVVGAKTSPLRVVGDTIYFLHAPPDKVKFKDFKDEKAIETHYTALSVALKKRNPVQDARFAFKHNRRYVFTANFTNPVGSGRTGDIYSLSAPDAKKLCPEAKTKLKLLEGDKFILSASGYCEGACRRYGESSEAYERAWNREMARLCHGGKLPQ